MSTFQIIMLMATIFFAFKVYEHVQGMNDAAPDDETPQGPKMVSGLIDEADAAYEADDMARAVMLLTEANALSPDTPEILNKLAFIRSKEGKNDEAIAHYEHSLKLDASDDLAHNALASLYRTKGDFEQAKAHYEAALAIDPEYEVTYFNYANLLVDMEDVETAKTMYAKALEIKPDFMQAKFELGKLS